MIKKIYLLFVLCSLLFANGGCATVDRQRNAELGVVEEKRLEVSADLKFEDVPIPYGFKFNKQDSFVFQNDFMRVGLLKYTGKANADKIVNFYQEQMPLCNWDILNIVEYGKVILSFEKNREICIITLEPVMTRTILSISLAPKPSIIKEQKK